MTKIQIKLRDAYSVLVLAGKYTLVQVPLTPVILSDGSESTLRTEVEIQVAERTLAALQP